MHEYTYGTWIKGKTCVIKTGCAQSGIEQLVARRVHSPKIVGSNPTPAIHWHIVQRSERLPVKQDVAGSNPAMPVKT